MGWLRDLWQILTKVAILTSEVEHLKGEIEVARRDIANLALTVSQIKNDLANPEATTQLVLDKYKIAIDHVEENLAAKFDVLTTRLDLKIMGFEHRLARHQSKSKKLNPK